MNRVEIQPGTSKETLLSFLATHSHAAYTTLGEAIRSGQLRLDIGPHHGPHWNADAWNRFYWPLLFQIATEVRRANDFYIWYSHYSDEHRIDFFLDGDEYSIHGYKTTWLTRRDGTERCDFGPRSHELAGWLARGKYRDHPWEQVRSFSPVVAECVGASWATATFRGTTDQCLRAELLLQEAGHRYHYDDGLLVARTKGPLIAKLYGIGGAVDTLEANDEMARHQAVVTFLIGMANMSNWDGGRWTAKRNPVEWAESTLDRIGKTGALGRPLTRWIPPVTD